MKCVNNMIALVILVGVWCSTLGADVPPASCAEKQMLDLFSKWRKGENLPISLPAIEIIEIPSMEGQYDGFGIKISFVTGVMKLAGVNNFNIEDLLVSVNDTLLKTFGSVHFPLLTLTGDNYNLKGRASLIYTLKGSGLMRTTFENVEGKFGIVLGPHGTGTEIKDLRLNFTVGLAKIDLAGSSWPINTVLNRKAKTIIDSYHNDMVKAATEGMKNVLNKYLAATTPHQLVSTFIGDCTIKN